jgi:hypothetical protein
MRPKLKLDAGTYNRLFSAIGTKDIVTLKVKANTLKLDAAISENNLSRKNLKTNTVKYFEDDSFYRQLKSYEKPKLGWSCDLHIIKPPVDDDDDDDGFDDVFNFNLYLPVIRTECKSRNVNFTINEKTVKLILEENEIFWILEVSNIN